MRSVRPLPLIAALLLAASVPFAAAEEIDFWNLRGRMPGNATSSNLTVSEVTEEGLFVRTDTEGLVAWPGHPLEGPAEAVTLRLRSSRAVTAKFAWVPTDDSPEGTMFQVPFEIPVTREARDVHVVLSDYDGWDWRTEAVGIVFPAGSELILEEVTFRHWTPTERLIEGWKSFWTFDDFKPHSINFLWGPLVAGSEPGREQLYANLPPLAWSATRLFYTALLLAAGAGLFLAYARGKRPLGLGVFTAVFCGLWLLFDARMGAEILSYAADDVRTYVRADGDEKVLRTHGPFYAAMEQLLPDIMKHGRYALHAPPGTIAFPNIRYRAYPSVPVLPDQNLTGVQLHVVFGDTNVTVDAAGRLMRGSEVLAASGSVIKRVHDTIFLYEAR